MRSVSSRNHEAGHPLKTSTAIPRELKDRVERELSTGEQVLWMDMPKPRYFTGASLGAFLFAIPWTAFAVFWTLMAARGISKSNSPDGFDAFPLFGIPFILVGVGMLSSPYFAYKKSLNTVYAVTNRRAITIDGGWSLTIRSYPPEKLQDLYRKENRDGTGDVIISNRVWRDSEGGRRSEELGFLRIQQAKEVELMLRVLAQQAGAREQGANG